MGQLELPQLVAIFLLVLLLGAVQPKQPLDTTALKGWQGEHHVAVSACHRVTSWATMRRGCFTESGSRLASRMTSASA